MQYRLTILVIIDHVIVIFSNVVFCFENRGQPVSRIQVQILQEKCMINVENHQRGDKN
jgi:hypothetical protein